MTVRNLFVALLIAVVTNFAAAQKIDRIIFFGDSLSDAGNNFIFSGTSSRQPFDLGPTSFSYDIGGHHYSNGNTWAEYLATSLHLPASGGPSLRSPGLFTDYAVGDARARANAPVFPFFDLSTQVGEFLHDFAGQVPANSLVVVFIGANDVNDALNALVTDPSGVTSAGILQAAGDAITHNIELLYGAGARMFLVVGIPDLGKTPYVQFIGQFINPQIPAIAGLFTGFINSGLAQFTAALPILLPPDPVHPLQFARFFDVSALLDQALASPASFGITNIGRCTVPGVIGNAICSTPNRYLFWDGTHPTTAAHAAVAKAALQLLPPQ